MKIKRMIAAVLSTVICASAMPFTALAVPEFTLNEEAKPRFNYEVLRNEEVLFNNYTSDMTYYISSNREYKFWGNMNFANFTPLENGNFVIVTEEYREAIITDKKTDSEEKFHFHYFYPVLTFMGFTKTDDELTAELERTFDYYDQERVDETIAKCKAVTEDVIMSCFDVYTELPDLAVEEDYNWLMFNALDKWYEDDKYVTYTTMKYTKFDEETENYFCLATKLSDEPEIAVTISDEECAEVVGRCKVSEFSLDPDYDAAEYDLYVIKSKQDGQVNVSTENGEEYYLDIDKGSFKRSTEFVDKTIWGDANDDGIASLADAVILTRHLLGFKDDMIRNNKAADMNKDGILDVYDLVLLRKQLLSMPEPNFYPIVHLDVVIERYDTNIMGENLGETKTDTFFTLERGDSLYEDGWVHNDADKLLLNPVDLDDPTYFADHSLILTIVDIDSEGVTIARPSSRGKKVIKRIYYDKDAIFGTSYAVADATYYNFRLTFRRVIFKPVPN